MQCIALDRQKFGRNSLPFHPIGDAKCKKNIIALDLHMILGGPRLLYSRAIVKIALLTCRSLG